VRAEVAYRTVVAMSGDIDSVRDAIASGMRPVVVFASPSAVEGFVGEVGVRSLGHVRPVAIGPTTARKIADLADLVATTSRYPDVFGLVSAVVAASRTREEIYVDAR
jgi:uroporphyrinogen-III synthase